MLDFVSLLHKAITAKKKFKHSDDIIKDAEYYRSIYSGKNQELIVTNYRKSESDAQKKQRLRINITRTKHVSKQIENIYDQLITLDKSALNVTSTNEQQKESLKKYAYDNNLEQIAFDFVKYYNLTDANAWLLCMIDELENIVFEPKKSDTIIDLKIVNNNVLYVIFKDVVKDSKGQSIVSYQLYHENGYVHFKNKKLEEIQGQEYSAIGNDLFYIDNIQTSVCFAFRLGYKMNVETSFNTSLSLLDPASELFRSLIYEGSELDVIKGTHGIVQKFVYAPRCDFHMTGDQGHTQCDGGYMTNCEKLTKCPSCKGSGMKIHTSSQDIVYVEEPMGQDKIKLSDMVHVEYIPDSILEFRKLDIKELQEEIVRTVFNSNYLTKAETNATATQARIDQQGVYSALGLMGVKVSDCYIWMLECVASIMGYTDIEIHHGYSLDLKLDTVETLIEKRSKAVNAGVPFEVVKALDYAILQKQNLDNPDFLNRMNAWEYFKPFNDKSENERMQILAGLERYDYHRVLYTYFNEIKKSISIVYGPKFYDASIEQQDDIVKNEVNKFVAEMKKQTDRIDFNPADE